MPNLSAKLPSAGKIDEISVPSLLARAWAERESGTLRLRQGNRNRTLQIKDGAPIAVTSDRNDDRFAQALQDNRKITASQRAQVEKLAAERQCAQASAVLALGLLEAKELYQAMRDQTRSEIGEVFEWRTGEFSIEPLAADFSSNAKPFDTLALLQSELPKRWGIDRLFESLMPAADLTGSVAPRFHLILEKLGAAGPFAKQIIDRLGESVSVGRLLGDCSGDPIAAATLWVLVESELLRPQESPKAKGEQSFEFEVEIEPENRCRDTLV